MPESINPMINGIGFYAIMSALDQMGINPKLLARQTSDAIFPIMQDVIKTFLSGKKLPTNWSELIEMANGIISTFDLADPEKLQLHHDDGSSTLKINDCMFSDVANFAQAAGYKHCPVCMIGAVTAGAIKALKLGEVKDTKVEKVDDNCTITLTSD